MGTLICTYISEEISCKPLEAMAPGPNMCFLGEKLLIFMVAMVTMATVVMVTEKKCSSYQGRRSKGFIYAIKSEVPSIITDRLLRFSMVYILQKYRFLKTPWIALTT